MVQIRSLGTCDFDSPESSLESTFRTMEQNTVSDDFHSCTTDDESQFATPALKLDPRQVNSPDDTALCGASSDLSLKEGSVFSSSSASSSGSESDSGYFLKKLATEEVSNNAMYESIPFEKVKDDMYKDLLEKVAFYEGELKSAQEKISSLEHELAQNVGVNLHDQFDNEAKILELQEKIAKLEATIDYSDIKNTTLMDELDRTKEMLCASEKEVIELEHKLKTEVDEVTHRMQSQVDSANGQLEQLQSKLEIAESEKMEMKNALESQEKRFKANINRLRTENSHGSEQVEILDRRLDAITYECDMVEAERDGLKAKLDTLNAETECNIVKIQQMEAEKSRLLADLEEMRFRADKLESEADSQRAVILDRAEEKREAIRQLCFAVEYYRTEYQHVCQAFGGHKRRPVMANGH